MAARPNSVDDLNSRPSIHFDARGVHVAFLNLFTYLFQDYRKL